MTKQTLGVRVDPATVEKLQTIADKHGNTVTDVCRMAIAQYLKQAQPDPIGERLTRIESVLNELVGVNTANEQGDKSTCKPGRKGKLITYRGKTQSAAQWSNELGLSVRTIRYRLSQGRLPDEILNQSNRR